MIPDKIKMMACGLHVKNNIQSTRHQEVFKKEGGINNNQPRNKPVFKTINW